MTLDDKLKGWREGTETLAPSDALLAKLAANVDTAPAAAPAPAPATATAFAVKVVVLVIAIGAATLLWWVRPAVESRPRPNAPALETSPSANPSEAACPPPNRARMPVGMAAPALMLPGPVAARAQKEHIQALRDALEHRPLTCEAQAEPLRSLLREELPDADRFRFLARLVFFCGGRGDTVPAALSRLQRPVTEASAPCSDADWCHAPKCTTFDEECARAFAARPPGSCNREHGQWILGELACERFVRGTATDAEVSRQYTHGWCLEPSAGAEAELLRRLTHGDAQ